MLEVFLVLVSSVKEKKFGFRILIFNIFGGFLKKKYFGGHFVYILGGYQKVGLYLGVIFMYFRVCS